MHIGEKIRARARELHIGSTALSRTLNMTKQNVYGIYKRKSIDTALLQKIGKVLDFDFFSLYYSPPKLDTTVARELADLREKYELLKELYEAKTGNRVPGSTTV